MLVGNLYICTYIILYIIILPLNGMETRETLRGRYRVMQKNCIFSPVYAISQSCGSLIAQTGYEKKTVHTFIGNTGSGFSETDFNIIISIFFLQKLTVPERETERGLLLVGIVFRGRERERAHVWLG